MHDRVTIFARFTNTQKVPKPEVVGSKPLCRKWMSRGDGVEIDSAISSTALSLHNLHSCKIWRYFIQFNHHSGSACEAISASTLVRYLHRRHHLKLPYLPRMFCSRFYFLVTLICVLCALQAYSSQVLSSEVLSRRSSPTDQLTNWPTEASGSIVIIQPDLLLAMKSVAIELTDVVESSDIIFIEFAMYLRSLSTLPT